MENMVEINPGDVVDGVTVWAVHVQANGVRYVIGKRDRNADPFVVASAGNNGRLYNGRYLATEERAVEVYGIRMGESLRAMIPGIEKWVG